MIRRASKRKPRQAGFTLIEIMLSMAILASMLSLVWGAFSIGARGKRRAEEIAGHYYQIRLSLNRMVREISMAYLSKNDQVAPIWPRTFFINERNSKGDRLMFSYLGHMRLNENAKESDQAIITYYVAPDPDNRSQNNLMRRESRRLGVERPLEDGPAYVLLEDIDEIHFEFFDEQANEWREIWNTRAVDGQPDRLPTKVRISLTMRNERDKLVTYVTSTRLHLRDPLWFSVPSS